jgi:hypothetical protein
MYEEGLINLWLYKEHNKLRDGRQVFALHIPTPSSTHTLMISVFPTSLTNPRKIVLVVLHTKK